MMIFATLHGELYTELTVGSALETGIKAFMAYTG